MYRYANNYFLFAFLLGLIFLLISSRYSLSAISIIIDFISFLLVIKKRAKKAGLYITDYIVRLSLETPIYIPVNMQPFLLELKRIGNNINQLTKKLMQRFLHRIISMNLLMQLKN